MTSPHVAALAPENIESFHRTLDQVAREWKYLTLLEAPPLADTREFVLGSLAVGNPHFVALADGEVVGWCDIRRHFFPAHAHRGTLGVGMLPTFRGHGLGRRLLETSLQAAFERGFVRVELDVYADNQRAIALYERLGFVREGVTRDAVCVDGDYRDAIGMALIRRP